MLATCSLEEDADNDEEEGVSDAEDADEEEEVDDDEEEEPDDEEDDDVGAGSTPGSSNMLKLLVGVKWGLSRSGGPDDARCCKIYSGV